MIRRMAADLDFPVEIEVLPTVREPDGLAISSRNAYLDREPSASARRRSSGPEGRRGRAPATATLRAAIVAAAEAELREAGIEPEYVEARDAEDLTPVAELNGRPVLVAVAAQVGRARLIDNVIVQLRGALARCSPTQRR